MVLMQGEVLSTLLFAFCVIAIEINNCPSIELQMINIFLFIYVCRWHGIDIRDPGDRVYKY